MNKLEYLLLLKKLNLNNPIEKTPKGQKFSIGDIVKIKNPLEGNIQLAQIEGTYFQICGDYGEKNKEKYCIRWFSTDNTTAWIDEDDIQHADEKDIVDNINNKDEPRTPNHFGTLVDLAYIKEIQGKFAKIWKICPLIK